MTADEKQTAIADINAALEELAQALSTVYGDQVVLEVLSNEGEKTSAPNFGNESHVIKKRDAGDGMDSDPTVMTRRLLNVSVMVSTDYPAMFAIIAGLVIALTLVSSSSNGINHTFLGRLVYHCRHDDHGSRT